MSDLISRQAAIDALMEILDRPNHAEFLYTDEICKALVELPSAQPESDKEKISDLLRRLYLIQSANLTTDGIVRKQYYCKELWKELFGEGETPVWMTW